MNRFRPKNEIDDSATAQVNQTENETKTTEEATTVKPAAPATNPFDDESLRKRISNELRSSDVSARQRDREFMNKWFQRSELTNSGNFNLVELQRRLDELGDSDVEFIPSLPMQEDVLMAFSKPEVDLFEEEKISLSGVFLKVDPHEDFDEFYSVPLLPMYNSVEETPLYMPPSHEDNLSCETDPVFADNTHSGIPCLNSLIEEISVDESIVEEALEELNAFVATSTIPAPVPAFIKCEPPVSDADQRPTRMIDPSALFEEWNRDSDVEPMFAETPCVEIEIEEVQIQAKPKKKRAKKSKAKVVSPKSEYWSESDRLNRFGRQKTTASCSSTRLPALHQIA